MRLVTEIPGHEVVEAGRDAPRKQRRKPREDEDHRVGDPPQDEPDEVRDREQEPEEDGEPVSTKVVGDDEADRMRLHRFATVRSASDARRDRLLPRLKRLRPPGRGPPRAPRPRSAAGWTTSIRTRAARRAGDG